MVTGRLGVAERLEAVVVVVVVVIFLIGHVNVDVTILEHTKYAMSNFLDLHFFRDHFEFVLLLFVGVVLLLIVVLTQTGVKGLTSPLCSIYALIFFRSGGKVVLDCSSGLQIVDWVVWSLQKLFMSPSVLMVTSILMVAWEGTTEVVKEEVTGGFEIPGHCL